MPHPPLHFFSLMKRNEAKKNQDKINLGVLSIKPISPIHGPSADRCRARKMLSIDNQCIIPISEIEFRLINKSLVKPPDRIQKSSELLAETWDA